MAALSDGGDGGQGFRGGGRKRGKIPGTKVRADRPSYLPLLKRESFGMSRLRSARRTELLPVVALHYAASA